MIANGHRGKCLSPFFVHGDQCLRGILEVLLDRRHDEEEHDAGVDHQRDGPEEAIVFTPASRDAGNAVRRSVQREFAKDRTPSGEFHSRPWPDRRYVLDVRIRHTANATGSAHVNVFG